MQLTVVGLNHQTAPLSIREKLAFAAANLPDAVSNLVRSEAAEEAVILSTCNRTELYCVGETEKIIDWLAQYHDLSAEEIRPYLYTLDNNETVRPCLPRRLRFRFYGLGRTANSRPNQRCRPRCARTGKHQHPFKRPVSKNLCRCQRSAYRHCCRRKLRLHGFCIGQNGRANLPFHFRSERPLYRCRRND